MGASLKLTKPSETPSLLDMAQLLLRHGKIADVSGSIPRQPLNFGLTSRVLHRFPGAFETLLISRLLRFCVRHVFFAPCVGKH